MNGDTIFLLACAAVFAGALFFTRRGRSAFASVAARSGNGRYGASFRDLDRLAEDEAYETLGRDYVANRAKRRAAEIQGDLPVPKAGPS